MWGDISLWLWFAFLWWLVMLRIFSCVYGPSLYIWKNVYSGLLCILFFPFQPPLWHMEIPRLDCVQASCNLHHNCNSAGSLTHCAELGIKLGPSQRQARSLTHCSMWKHTYTFLIGLLFASLTLCCLSCWCILNINSLFVISFANIFSHSVACLFTLLVVWFALQKLLSLIRTHLFVFAFRSHLFPWP